MKSALKRVLIISNSSGRALPLVQSLLKAGFEVPALLTTQLSEEWPKTESALPIISLNGLKVGPASVEIAIKHSPDLVVVAGFNSILPQALIDLAPFGTLNLHGGPLPHYRGGSPLNWQIINGEKQIGISVIRLNQAIDGGPIVAEGKFDLNINDDIASVHEKANALFAKLTLEAVEGLAAGSLQEREQDESEAQYWHQRKMQDGKICWETKTALEVHNFVRALTRPYPGAFTSLKSKRVTVHRVEIPSLIVRGTPGRVLFLRGEGPFVICRDRAVNLIDYQIEDALEICHGDELV